MPFFFLLQALNCKEAEITDSEPMAFIFFRIQNFSGFTFFLWPMFKNWETAQKTQDFPNFLEHETFHSNTRSTFLPGNNLLDLGRDSNFREYTHSPVDPSPHHSLMPFSSLTTHLFILLPGSGSNFICRFSDTKTTEGQATGTVKTQPRARQMTCTHQHWILILIIAFLCILFIIPASHRQICMEILPLLWAENFNWSQNSISWN